MRNTGSWIAFLTMLFALVGLCGLFASFATSVPLERGMARSALLDRVLVESAAADGAARLERLRPALGGLATAVLDGPGALPERVAAARAVVLDEQRREEASVAYRIRLMLGVVTVIAAVLGGGILSIVGRGAAQAALDVASQRDPSAG
jgi:hypothetical protein